MCYPVVILLVEVHCLDVVKHTQQVRLDGVGVGSLAENLEKSWIRHKEEPRKDQSLLLQVARQ